MKCQKSLAGYTIIEVMIFLAVSSALLLSAMSMINGQQDRVRFTTGVRDFENKMQDIINDVETGVYSSTGDISCTSDPAASVSLTIQPISKEQGSNENCVFLGKAIQFYRKSPADFVSNFNIMTIAGKRLAVDPATGVIDTPVNIAQTKPAAFYVSTKNTGLELGEMLNSIEVSGIRFVDSLSPFHTTDSFDEIAIISSASLRTQGNTVSNLANGRASIAALNGNAGHVNDIPKLAGSIPNLNDSSVNLGNNGVIICMRDGQGGRPAAVTIGAFIGHNGTPAPRPSSQKTVTQAYFDDEATLFGCAA